MRDNRYTNFWGETPEEEEKHRQYMYKEYDRIAAKNQTPYPGTDSQNDFGQTAYQPESNNFEQAASQPVGNMNHNSYSAPQSEASQQEPSWLDKAGYAANGALQGLSFGLADELEGLMGGLGYGLASLNSNWNKTGESFWDAAQRGYTQTRDMRRQQLQDGYEKAPVLTRGMEALGAAVSPINKIGQISQYAPRSAKLAREAVMAPIKGAAYGFGSGEGDFASQAGSMLQGGIIGAFSNKFANKVQPAINFAFMDETARGVGKDFIGNAFGNAIQAGIDNWDDYRKRRRF